MDKINNLYFFLDKEDSEINQLIDFWEQHAKEEGHRNTIVELKKRKNKYLLLYSLIAPVYL